MNYLLATGLARLDPDLQQDVTALSHANLARWCLNYVHLNPIAPLSPISNDRRHNQKLPLIKYAFRNTFAHMEIAYTGGGLPLTSVNDIPVQIWIGLADTFGYWSPSGTLTPFTHSESATVLYFLLEDNRTMLAEALLEQYRASDEGLHAKLLTSTCNRDIDNPVVPVDINSPCWGAYCNALGSAVAHNHAIIVEMLIDRGADVNLHNVPAASHTISRPETLVELAKLYTCRYGTIIDLGSPLSIAVTTGNK